MLSIAAICSIRYCDIDALEAVAADDAACTARAYRAKYIAAWPAELAPPTM